MRETKPGTGEAIWYTPNETYVNSSSIPQRKPGPIGVLSEQSRQAGQQTACKIANQSSSGGQLRADTFASW